jgi:hypothetical protein
LFAEDITIYTVVTRFIITTILTSGISIIYKKFNRDKEENYLMMHTFVFLAVAIAAAMMIIGNNLARAFGLVGAVSIIRFRSAIKSSRDMAFVLIVIVVGMACGLGYIVLAIIGALFFGFLIGLFGLIKFGQRGILNRDYLIKIAHECGKCSRVEIEQAIMETALYVKFSGLKADEDRRTLSYEICVDDYHKLEILSDTLRDMGKKEEISVSITSL